LVSLTKWGYKRGIIITCHCTDSYTAIVLLVTCMQIYIWLHLTLFTLQRLFDVLAFQQLEIDYIIGERHKELMPNSSGPAAILRIFGVTKEGMLFFSLQEQSFFTCLFLTFDVIL
jgi:hypothetical protein